MRRRWVLFGLYCAAMAWLLFGQRIGFWVPGSYWQQLCENINLKPMDTVGRYLWVLENSQQLSAVKHAVVNLAGNVVMFVPLGVFLPCLWQKQKRFWIFLLTVVGTILSVELIQLFTLLGKCDVDDVLLNLMGAVLGYGVACLMTKQTEK